MLKHLLIFVALVAISFSTASPLSKAQGVCDEPGAKNSSYCQNVSSSTDNPLAKTIGKVTDIIALLGGFVAIVFIIVGGYKFVLSNGDPQKAASGRMTVLYAIIGLVVIISARTVISYVINRL